MHSLKFRTVWISDTHLGLKDAKVEFLLDFLKHVETDTLYLVGDIIDFWKLKSGGGYWPQMNNTLIRLIMDRARNGTRVVYVPGNHDETFRQYTDLFFGGIEITPRAHHETADGRKLLVLHGDEFDCIVMHNKWLAHMGSDAYDLLLWINRWFNYARRKLGMRYWSLSAYLKQRVKEAVKYIGNYEEAVVSAARAEGVDGVVCGHIHHAAITGYEGIEYINCGDWVESCTAVAEHADGSMQLINWAEESAQLLDSGEGYAHCDSDGRLASTN